MLTKQDLQQIESLGISEAMVEHQMEQHRKGFSEIVGGAAALAESAGNE